MGMPDPVTHCVKPQLVLVSRGINVVQSRDVRHPMFWQDPPSGTVHAPQGAESSVGPRPSLPSVNNEIGSSPVMVSSPASASPAASLPAVVDPEALPASDISSELPMPDDAPDPELALGSGMMLPLSEHPGAASRKEKQARSRTAAFFMARLP
jgi:hypothetical protein